MYAPEPRVYSVLGVKDDGTLPLNYQTDSYTFVDTCLSIRKLRQDNGTQWHLSFTNTQPAAPPSIKCRSATICR